ncbi:hypothetical protein [Sporomusa aerivorans]|uniref:hypothetical protein n=1 Tax=Sporomusa aerivorans TaxID=204936 RepID=UPI00352A20DE
MEELKNRKAITWADYRQILLKIEELEKELQVQQVKISMLREEQKKLLDILKSIGLADFDNTPDSP